MAVIFQISEHIKITAADERSIKVETQSIKGDPKEWRNNAPCYYGTLLGACMAIVKEAGTKGVKYKNAQELYDQQCELVRAMYAAFGEHTFMSAAEFYKKFGGAMKPIINKTKDGAYVLSYVAEDEPVKTKPKKQETSDDLW